VATFSTRTLTRAQDWSIMVLLLAMVAFGFLGANPHLSPFPARTMVLLHMLLGNLVLVLVPLSKIAHCVLFPLTQLVFQLGWHFPAESGRHVAIALAKENEPI
jgi:nitrate reductase gamma subunit